MLYPSTGWMLFDEHLSLGGSQDLLQPPVILTSGNGWVYKPDEARTPHEIKRGLNKAWPRSRQDYGIKTYHDEWHSEFMRNELESRGWKLPTKIEKPQMSPRRVGNDSFAIHWNSQPWGWQSISMNIREPSHYGYGDKKMTVTYSVQSHPAIDWYDQEKVGDVYGGSGTHSHNVSTMDRDAVRDMVRKWTADPWGETMAHIPDTNRLQEIMQPPVEKMQNLTYLDDYDDAGDGLDFYGISAGNADFWTKGKIEQVMKSDVAWEALTRVLKAFEFTGYEIRVTTEYDYYGNKDLPITGIEIEIPKDPDSTKRSRSEGHTVKIDRDGIGVTCGFVQDEKLWMEREKRMAREHMALLEEDLFTEFSIDLNE